MNATRHLPCIAALIGALLVSSPAAGAAGEKAIYPVKPVRLIVPFPAGDAADVIAQLLARPLAAQLQQAVTIDNRSGKGGITDTEIAARAKPDGYTISIGTTVTHVIAPLAMKPRYTPWKISIPSRWSRSCRIHPDRHRLDRP